MISLFLFTAFLCSDTHAQHSGLHTFVVVFSSVLGVRVMRSVASRRVNVTALYSHLRDVTPLVRLAEEV